MIIICFLGILSMTYLLDEMKISFKIINCHEKAMKWYVHYVIQKKGIDATFFLSWNQKNICIHLKALKQFHNLKCNLFVTLHIILYRAKMAVIITASILSAFHLVSKVFKFEINNQKYALSRNTYPHYNHLNR